jgi:molybdate transport system permease protein
MGESGATTMIAGNIPGKTQTLSLAVYDAVLTGNDAQANALVLLMSVLCIVILVVAGRLLNPPLRAGSCRSICNWRWAAPARAPSACRWLSRRRSRVWCCSARPAPARA